MKSVLVTGGTRGLGLATTRTLVERGFFVIATGRKPSDALNQLIDGSDGKICFAPFDLSETTAIKDFVKRVTQEHGDLYGLINNAALGLDGVLATMHERQIEELIRVNVTGTILLTKYVSRSMLMGRTGRIVNVASIIGHTGFNGLSVYAATKGAMLSFTRSLARELGKAGITVNSISPGFLETEMTAAIGEEKLSVIRRRSPSGTLPTVDDVAGTIAFLLSDAAASMTGTDVVVDAGNTA